MLKNITKLLKKFALGVGIYLSVIAILMVLVCIYQPEFIIPSIVIFVTIIIFTYIFKNNNDNRMFKVIQDLTLAVNNTTGQALINFPFPVLVVKESGDITWKNEEFTKEFVSVNISENIDEILKELKTNTQDVKQTIQMVIDNKTYNIIAKGIKVKSNAEKIYVVYFVDKTDYIEILKKYEDEDICLSVIMIDNYEEMMSRIPDESKPLIMAEIEKQIYDWASTIEGLVIKSERDKFIFIFKQMYLEQLEESKFSILDSVKEINTDEKLQITLSISVAGERSSEYEKYKSANATMDIALGRGGDQAVIKKEGKYYFFGGRATEIEKRTKVKARAIAHALEELITGSEDVMIMGHVNSDIDCIGSAIGLTRLVKTLGKTAYILYDSYDNSMENYMKEISNIEEYADIIIKKEEALEKISKETLLIVLDTHKTNYVEMAELLEETEKIVLIDHHRRATDFIDSAILTFHEVYASSTAELVAEIIQYSASMPVLSELEAESLYAGIMVDTKNFTFKTGVRTFESAAYLRKIGIDILKIKKWFQSNIEDYNIVAGIVKNAQIVNDTIAISTYGEDSANTSLICAKGADELLTINNITASFVIGDLGNQVCISGRSIGDVNVQVILEKLGGGGHITVAGAQLEDITIDEAKEKLITCIEEYFEENLN